MNGAERLLAIVLELRGKRWRRAEDLAAMLRARQTN
jgi:hypothetical protein